MERKISYIAFEWEYLAVELGFTTEERLRKRLGLSIDEYKELKELVPKDRIRGIVDGDNQEG